MKERKTRKHDYKLFGVKTTKTLSQTLKINRKAHPNN